MAAIIAAVVANKAIILGVLFGVSEALAAIPAVQANSIFQLMQGLVNKAMGK